MKAVVDREQARGSSVGGTVEVWAEGLPPGLGTFVHPDRRLDARLGQALLGVQAIKAVEIGDGTRTDWPGDRVHDAIFHSPERGFYRNTNRAGGIEGGMTNGSPLRVRAFMKPIPTMLTPLPSVDLAHPPGGAGPLRAERRLRRAGRRGGLRGGGGLGAGGRRSSRSSAATTWATSRRPCSHYAARIR